MRKTWLRFVLHVARKPGNRVSSSAGFTNAPAAIALSRSSSRKSVRRNRCNRNKLVFYSSRHPKAGSLVEQATISRTNERRRRDTRVRIGDEKGCGQSQLVYLTSDWHSRLAAVRRGEGKEGGKKRVAVGCAMDSLEVGGWCSLARCCL